MPKELIINATIPLPEDYLDESELVAKVRPIVEAFKAGLREGIGEDAFKCYVEAREPPAPPKARKPRAPRSDAGLPRGPRAVQDVA